MPDNVVVVEAEREMLPGPTEGGVLRDDSRIATDLVPLLVPAIDDIHQRVSRLLGLQRLQHLIVIGEEAEGAGDDLIDVRLLRFRLSAERPRPHDDGLPFDWFWRRCRRCWRRRRGR